MKFKVNFNFLL